MDGQMSSTMGPYPAPSHSHQRHHHPRDPGPSSIPPPAHGSVHAWPTGPGVAARDPGESGVAPDMKGACLSCRKAKVKCLLIDQSPCERCERMEKDCVFQRHKRGRKPGKIIDRQVETRIKALVGILEELNNLTAKMHKSDPALSRLVHGMAMQMAASDRFADYLPSSLGSQVAYSPSTSSTLPLLGQASSPYRRSQPAILAQSLLEIEDSQASSTIPHAVQTYSNPLKLLAHASETMDREGSEAVETVDWLGGGTDCGRGTEHDFVGGSSSSGPRGRARGGTKTSYFNRGVLFPVYDNNPELDPISKGLVTAEKAEELLELFYNRFQPHLHIFDRHLSTLTYIRRRSNLLLTVICAVTTRFSDSPESAKFSDKLYAYMHDVLLPDIFAGSYRNVEVAQAFIILTAYHPMVDTAMADQTWSYLGVAMRMCTELGYNHNLHSYTVPSHQRTDIHMRQVRNQERLWISLFVIEKDLSSQRGQRFIMGEDGVIATCSSWHKQPYALPEDEFLIASLELRRIMTRHSDYFNAHILHSLALRIDREAPAEGSSMGGATERTKQLGLQLDFFRSVVHADLQRWKEVWLFGAGQPTYSGDTFPYQAKGELSFCYATLLALALPLRSRMDDSSDHLTPIYTGCYVAVVEYLAVFLDRLDGDALLYAPGAQVVTAAYCAVFALKFCSLPQEKRTFVSPEQVISLVCRLAQTLTAWSNYLCHPSAASTSGSFAEHLLSALDAVMTSKDLSPSGNRRGIFAHPTQMTFQAEVLPSSASNRANEAPTVDIATGTRSSSPLKQVPGPPKFGATTFGLAELGQPNPDVWDFSQIEVGEALFDQMAALFPSLESSVNESSADFVPTFRRDGL